MSEEPSPALTTTGSASQGRSRRTQWELAIELLPHLVRTADLCTTTSYKKVAQILRVDIRATRHPLNALYEVCEEMGLPELWTLVVGSDGEPSDDILHLTWDSNGRHPERRHLWRAMVLAVHAYPWALVQERIVEALRRRAS